MSDDVNYRELMVAKTLTREELDQEAVFAEQFEHWWDAEGQYHRAGGNDYCKTFAWWAWLNREKSKQAEIDELQKQVNVANECINTLVNEKLWYLDKITKAIAHLDSFDLSRAGMNKLQRSIESALEALRGDNA